MGATGIFLFHPTIPNYPKAKFPGVVVFSEIYQGELITGAPVASYTIVSLRFLFDTVELLIFLQFRFPYSIPFYHGSLLTSSCLTTCIFSYYYAPMILNHLPLPILQHQSQLPPTIHHPSPNPP